MQLDAEKAFDSLWRNGLLFKLKGKIPDVHLRALAHYYRRSEIIVKYNNEISNQIKINDGVKQGGFISGYLFNFFMDDLLDQCVSLNIGCKLGNLNVST